MRVALVNPPFYALDRPNLGLGLLHAVLQDHGFRVFTHYFNLAFASRIGIDTYERIDTLPRTQLVGEWLFKLALWPEDPGQKGRFINDVLRNADGSRPDVSLVRTLLEVRRLVQPFIRECAEQLVNYPIVGLSTSYQQNVASLAIARALKEMAPACFVILGGANCVGDMGRQLLADFTFLDAICTGEGDRALPELLVQIEAGKKVEAVPGVVLQRKAASDSSHAPHVALDKLPYPDFDDFFVEQQNAQGTDPVVIPFETSRGCWWGEKSHCTFCGLNGEEMTFRQKTADRAFDEIRHLGHRYGHHTRLFAAADNILPMRFIHELLPQTSALDIDIFYETKANLPEAAVRALREGRVTTIQPGIESLSTPVLRLMRKGVTAIQNVRLLKLCRQHGITPLWNYLAGFPGETAEHYRCQPQLIRAIRHLHPPSAGLNRVRFDRFSPYFQSPDSFGLSLRPYRAYFHVYSRLPEASIRRLAYYFEDERPTDSEYLEPVAAAIDEWRTAPSAWLFTLPMRDHLIVCDTREEPQQTWRLDGLERSVFEACHDIVSRRSVVRAAGSYPRAERVIDWLLNNRLVLQEGKKLLNLAIPLGPRFLPPPEIVQKAYADNSTSCG